MRAGRDGAVLAAILALMGVSIALGATLWNRSREALRTAAWAREHVVLRLLAESAVDELWVEARERATQPGDPVFEALRGPAAAGPVTLGSIAPVATLSEVHRLASTLSRPVTLLSPTAKSMVMFNKLDGVEGASDDRTGVLRLEAAFRAGSGLATVTERLVSERSFRVTRVGLPFLPAPLDRARLVIAATEARTLPNFCPPGTPVGPPVVAIGGPDNLRLADLLTSDGEEGIRRVDESERAALERALAELSPAALVRRATHVTRSATTMARLLSRREADQTVTGPEGIFVLLSNDPLCIGLKNPPFRGRCLIASTGPLAVGEVQVADPTRDSVILVSSSRLAVLGRRVDAALVSCSDDAGGVVFGEAATVAGPVFSSRFPGFFGADARELGECRFGAGIAAGPGAGPGPDSLVVAFSPSARRVVHSRF